MSFRFLWIRAALYCVALPLLLVPFVGSDHPTPWFLGTLLPLVLVWGVTLGRPRLRVAVQGAFVKRRVLRRLEFLLWTAVLVVFSSELFLVLLGQVSTNPLLMPPNAKSERRIESWRFPRTLLNGSRTNSGGYNDTEWTLAKPSGTFRILALGDSFAFGIVGYEANYLTLLEQSLDKRFEENIEILNLGLTGINPEDYLHLLNNEGLAYAPDLVLVGFYAGNDFQPVRKASHLHLGSWQLYAIAKRTLMVGRRAAFSWRFFRNDLQEGTSVLDHEASFSWEEFQRINAGYLPYLKTEHTRRVLRALEHTEQVLRDIVKRSAPRRMVLSVAPSELQVRPELRAEILSLNGLTEADLNLDAPAQVLDDMLTPLGVTVIDLRPALMNSEAKGRNYHPRDTHWNLRGNRVVADALHDPLETIVRQLVKESPNR